MTTIRLLLADDHPLIREGFRSLLNKNERFEIVGIAENGKELVELAGKVLPDIILSDISMPVMNGMDAIEQIRKLYPAIKSVVLTMHEEREYIINALKIGVHGYILKMSSDLTWKKQSLQFSKVENILVPLLPTFWLNPLFDPNMPRFRN